MVLRKAPDRARALDRIQRNEFFPAVNAVGSGGKDWVPADLSSAGSFYIAEQYSVNLGISSWEIDFFERIRSLGKRALEEYFAPEEARRSARILLVGLPVPGDLLPEALSNVTPLKEISPGTSSEVLWHHPDFLSAENLLKAAHANIGAARAALFPRITLTTAFGTACNELSGLFKAGRDTWNFSSQIVLPIFDARAWAALEATKVEREIAVAQYEKAIQTAFREGADALAQRGTVGDQMEAQRALYATQTGFIAIRLANLSNQVRLFAVLGGGRE